jgi:hypothetical protein
VDLHVAEDLHAVEEELVRHAQSDRRRWQHVATLLMRVERERLWQTRATSFSAWLKTIARRADLEESALWRCLKAGRIYLEATGESDIAPDVAVSAESLELADKIGRHAPKGVTADVLLRTVDGELTRTELRKMWSTYRPAAGGATARGRLPDDPEAREETLAARRAVWEANKRKPENRAEVRRSELVASFASASWLATYDQARLETGVARLGGKLAAVLVVRRETSEPGRVELHGLWTCLSRPELADFEYNAPASLDYVWLGIPMDLSDVTLQKAPHMLGVLGFARNRTLSILREAKRRQLDAKTRIDALGALLARSYLWP